MFDTAVAGPDVEGDSTSVDVVDSLRLLCEDVSDPADAVELIRQVETLGRRVDAMRVALLGSIEQRGLYDRDGHAGAKVMIRHVGRLSSAEANRRAAIRRAFRHLVDIAAVFDAGELGMCQAARIARAYSNPRVRETLEQTQSLFIEKADTLSYRGFDLWVTDWVNRVDQDGARDTNQRNHDNRDVKLIQDYDGSWNLTGGCAALQGAEMRHILDRYIDAEFRTDWNNAQQIHGDTLTVTDLSRSDNQRRFDALHQIFQDAATNTTTGHSSIVTNIVIDQQTFENTLARLNGATGQLCDPTDDNYRCSTIDATPLEPTETVAAGLLGHYRRVVIGADNVVINLGHKQRLFTGSAALAVKLSNTECYWPGCYVPASQCQIDHLTPHSRNGPTNPHNGGIACGRHNRHKEHGYNVKRDPNGTWHITRPDGTEIDP